MLFGEGAPAQGITPVLRRAALGGRLLTLAVSAEPLACAVKDTIGTLTGQPTQWVPVGPRWDLNPHLQDRNPGL